MVLSILKVYLAAAGVAVVALLAAASGPQGLAVLGIACVMGIILAVVSMDNLAEDERQV